MNSSVSRTVDRLRQPEYTGENRCIPCTTVNVVIAVALGAAVAVLYPPLGVAALAVSLAAIYLRGYLVPGTPTLTKRYFPDWLLAKFDKGPEAESAVDVDAGDDAEIEHEAVDPEELFLEYGVVEPCADADDLCLTEAVRTRWRDRIAALRDGDRASQVADLLETDPEETTLEHGDAAVIARADGRQVARWESDAAVLADVAADEALADEIPGWERLPVRGRSQLSNGLRAFAEACPACDAPISIDEETVESCCRTHEVYALTCDECEARVLEVTQ